MKKLRKNLARIFILALILFFPHIAHANELHSIDINVEIDQNGIGHVKETWQTNEENDDATEKYKVISDLGDIKIRNFKVESDDGSWQEVSPWNIDASFDDKAYKYGMVEDGDRVELCWGITNFGENTYHLSYDIDPLVVGLNDYDMVYFRFIKENLDPLPDKISITIKGPNSFDDEVLMWGFGFEGDVHNVDGEIVAKSDGDVQYGQVMLRLPKGTFDTSYNIDKDFDFYADMAQEGSDYGSADDAGDYDEDYEYGESTPFNPFLFFLSGALSLIGPIIGFIFFGLAFKSLKGSSDYKIINKKVLKKANKFKDQYYRDIPYDGPIEDTYLISQNANGLNINFENYMTAFLLKWVYGDAISFGEEEEKVLFFDTKSSYITINHEPTNMSQVESKFFDVLQRSEEYTDDGKIKQKHIEKFIKKNESFMEDYFESFSENSLDQLVDRGYLINNKKKKALSSKFNNKITITDTGIDLYENFIKFKNYLEDYSLIEERDINEVKLWDGFMIYAAIYGISKKVYSNFTEIYPEYENMSAFDFYMISNITSYSSGISSAASSNLSSFESGGFGGSSSFGGGGGSFGGGSGGSGGGSR
ncbi:DUF2207 family protein [Anaerococcus provencensis]|uniref:DUF2207 family protein n=1 Tax=Anaerococcus provencensis TaxID=938293 RepID=UPI0002DFFCEB|nr:DUF2207 domain-containing protein [Anaerococcus provencensis]